MGYAIGIVLALCVSVFARAVGFDRDRAFYPTVLVVIASYYVLFAAMGGSMRALIVESIVMSALQATHRPMCDSVCGWRQTSTSNRDSSKRR